MFWFRREGEKPHQTEKKIHCFGVLAGGGVSELSQKKRFLPLQKPELIDTRISWQYKKLHLSQVACSQTFYPTKSHPNVRFQS